MENTIKGWQYISAIFQKLIESFDTDSLIEPQFIFRGITRRYFSSSKSIPEYLKEFPDFVSDKEPMTIRNKRAYEKLYEQFVQSYKSLASSGKVQPLEILERLMECDNYKYIAPEYIKSGAAIKMQNLKNRSHLDYVNYIRNLINDAKYRFSEYVDRKFSDIEILADIQHRGGASCLVDFSNNFLISLWFATQTNKDDNDFGYLFCYDVNVEMLERDNLCALSHDKCDEPIEKLLYETTKSGKYTEEQSYKFWLWKPAHINERIARQDSVFVFGLKPFHVKEHGIIVIPIPYDWKKYIQLVLKSYFGITEEGIYCDNNGFATSHDKEKPHERVISSYFNEQFSPISKNKNLIFSYLQNGMACLFQGEYNLALQYFVCFESSIKYRIEQHLERKPRKNSIDECVQDIKMFIIDIELHFSKALCLRHLNHEYRAIDEYMTTQEKCLSLLTKIADATKVYKNDDEIIRIQRSEKYVQTKYQKTIKDLMDLFYDTKQYGEVLKLVDSMDQSGLNLSKSLIEVIRNEAKTLQVLDKLIQGEKVSEKKIIKSEMSGNIQPFYHVLNLYFNCVLTSISKGSLNEPSLKKLLDAINNKGKMDYTQNCYFTEWDFSDIVSMIKKYQGKSPALYRGLMAVTVQMEDFMAFINSKLRIPPY